jgi:hypothetical protein
MRHTSERGVTITSPVEKRDVPVRELEGWTVAPPTRPA